MQNQKWRIFPPVSHINQVLLLLYVIFHKLLSIDSCYSNAQMYAEAKYVIILKRTMKTSDS